MAGAYITPAEPAEKEGRRSQAKGSFRSRWPSHEYSGQPAFGSLAINNRGRIVGSFLNAGGVEHGFLARGQGR